MTAGSITRREIESQPAIWRQALSLDGDALAALPRAGESVLALGCGTSFYVLAAYAHRRQALGGGVTRAAIASEVDELGRFDRIVYLSRSGTTSELVRADAAIADGTPTVAICGTPGSPIAELADEVVLLSFADEKSVVQTRFATTVLALLRRSVGEDVASLPEAAETALAAPLELSPDEHDHLVFLGGGWTVPLAHEAALKCIEAAQIHAEAYAIGEYRHGPIAAAGARTAVWSLAPVPADLRAAVVATGARLVECRRDPLAELVRVHRVALAYALHRSLDPDRPRHLNRSVILDGQ